MLALPLREIEQLLNQRGVQQNRGKQGSRRSAIGKSALHSFNTVCATEALDAGAAALAEGSGCCAVKTICGR